MYKILCNFKIQTDFTFLRFHSKQGDEVMNTQEVKVKETEKTLLSRKDNKRTGFKMTEDDDD